MSNPIGPLTPADESLCHQIVDTFAVVSQSDVGWTEKVCAMAMARDGSVQLGFGLGKYTNRNIIDAYAGTSRGVEQTIVRASRRLSPNPELTVMGPIHYEVVEPLRKVRFVLEPNDIQPIAFDWLFEGTSHPSSSIGATPAPATALVPSSCAITRSDGARDGWTSMVSGSR